MRVLIFVPTYNEGKNIGPMIDALNSLNFEKNILIVDDNPENLLALELILKNLDVEIIKAESGNEALSSILYNDYALIILDVQMPEMDGYEVADILKSEIYAGSSSGELSGLISRSGRFDSGTRYFLTP